MGYYFNGSSNTGKAAELVRNHGGKIVNEQTALAALQDGQGVFCVVDNGMFEAAGFAFDADEFNAFTLPSDYRPKTFVVLDRKIAEMLSNYHRRSF